MLVMCASLIFYIYIYIYIYIYTHSQAVLKLPEKVKVFWRPGRMQVDKQGKETKLFSCQGLA